jgi:hypothetical protein
LKKTYHEVNLKPTYTVEDTAEKFRDHVLEPLMLPSSCPWCKEPASMSIIQVDVEDRIEARIGAYRIACCESCGAQAITNARVAYQKKHKGLFTDKEYDAFVRDNFTSGGPKI